MDKKNVEAIFPLSPMQEALLVHGLQAGKPDPGFLQLRCSLHGELDRSTFEQAWRHVVHRHASLRATVHWQDLEKPLQVVFRHVDLPWVQEDWRTYSIAEQQMKLDAYLQADRERGLDLTQAPVMRLALFQLADKDQWYLVWSCHHVLLDGWSGALVLREVSEWYESASNGARLRLADPRPYKEYVTWLQQQDSSEAEAFWKRDLDGLATTALPFDGSLGRSAAGRSQFDEIKTELSPASTAGLQAFARQHHLSLSTLLQGAWALCLQAYGRTDDVSFGMTVSGRSVGPPGIESMIGLFINTVPVRMNVVPGDTVKTFLSRLQERQVDRQPFEWTPLARIHGWIGRPLTERLFESLLVFQNYPTQANAQVRHLVLRNLRGDVTSGFPLTLLILPGEILAIVLQYDRDRFESGGMTRVLRGFRTLLENLAAGTNRPITNLLAQWQDTEWTPVRTEFIGDDTGGDGQVGYRRITDEQVIAPRTSLELALVRIFEHVLQVGPVGIQDDFFELGGHSLLVPHLIETIEREMGRKLSISALLPSPTVAHLARILQDKTASTAWSSLVPLQPSGSLTPLFVVHSWEGDVLLYRQLARRMAPDRPVYGLQALGLDGKTAPLDRVEAMAELYIHEMKTVQPHGPYHLLGMCFSIKVVFEMARQLSRMGEPVASLVILDTPPPKSQSLRYYVRRIRDFSSQGGFVPALRNHVNWRIEKQKQRKQEGHEPAGTQQIEPIQLAFKNAWNTYVPQPFPGRLTLVRSSEYAARRDRTWHLGVWEDLSTGGVRSIVVPGEHVSMLREPYVQELAARLRENLDQAPTPATGFMIEANNR